MNDLDYMEIDADLDFDDEFGDSTYYEDEPVTRRLTEDQLNELAADLLAVSDDEDMEQFLGKLVGKVAKGAGKFLKSGAGKALAGGLKGIAKAALPAVGGAIGTLALPGVGTALGSQLGSAVGSLFEAEVEGLSPEDQDFEIARRVVKLGEVATRDAIKNPTPAGAKAAVKKAVKKVAPSAAEMIADDDDLDEIAAQLVEADSDEEIGAILGGLARRYAAPAARAVWSAAKPAVSQFASGAWDGIKDLGKKTLIASAKGGADYAHGRLQSWLDDKMAEELSYADPYDATRRIVGIAHEAAGAAENLSKKIPPKKAAVIALKKAAKAAKAEDDEFGGYPMQNYGHQRRQQSQRYGQPYGRGYGRSASSGRWVRRGRNIIIMGA